MKVHKDYVDTIYYGYHGRYHSGNKQRNQKEQKKGKPTDFTLTTTNHFSL